jgi:hypothetical protein
MGEPRPGRPASSPRRAARPGYFLLAGALAAALLGTTANSEAQGQKAKGESEKVQLKRMINLIPRVDLALDVVRGKWSRAGKGLKCDDQHFAPRV